MQQKWWQKSRSIRIHYWLAFLILQAALTLYCADLLLSMLPLTLTPGGLKNPSLLFNVTLFFVTSSPLTKTIFLLVVYVWYLYANLLNMRLLEARITDSVKD